MEEDYDDPDLGPAWVTPISAYLASGDFVADVVAFLLVFGGAALAGIALFGFVPFLEFLARSAP